MIDPLYYRAGLYVAFRAYRAEAHIRGGLLPEISQETLIQFLATDIEFSQNPTVNEQISMRRSQEELLGRFKVQESQAWHDLQKIKFASKEMREGMHFGIANISVLIRKQSASQGGL